MIILYFLPPLIGFLLLAAHFFRAENQLAMLASLILIALMLVRRPWAAQALQVCLLLGSVEWLRTAIALGFARNEMGQPFLRLAIILGGVALFTALSCLIFRTSRIRAYFRFETQATRKEDGTHSSSI